MQLLDLNYYTSCLLSGSSLLVLSQITGEVGRNPFDYANALVYVTRNDTFLTGATLFSETQALAYKPLFRDYQNKTDYSELKVVIGCSPYENNGDRCNIKSIDYEPENEIRLIYTVVVITVSTINYYEALNQNQFYVFKLKSPEFSHSIFHII